MGVGIKILPKYGPTIIEKSLNCNFTTLNPFHHGFCSSDDSKLTIDNIEQIEEELCQLA